MKKLKRISLLMLALVLSLSMVFSSTFVFALEEPAEGLDETVEEMLAQGTDESENGEQLEEETEEAEEPSEESEPYEPLSEEELAELPGLPQSNYELLMPPEFTVLTSPDHELSAADAVSGVITAGDPGTYVVTGTGESLVISNADADVEITGTFKSISIQAGHLMSTEEVTIENGDTSAALSVQNGTAVFHGPVFINQTGMGSPAVNIASNGKVIVYEGRIYADGGSAVSVGSSGAFYAYSGTQYGDTVEGDGIIIANAKTSAAATIVTGSSGKLALRGRQLTVCRVEDPVTADGDVEPLSPADAGTVLSIANAGNANPGNTESGYYALSGGTFIGKIEVSTGSIADMLLFNHYLRYEEEVGDGMFANSDGSRGILAKGMVGSSEGYASAEAGATQYVTADATGDAVLAADALAYDKWISGIITVTDAEWELRTMMGYEEDAEYQIPQGIVRSTPFLDDEGADGIVLDGNVHPFSLLLNAGQPVIEDDHLVAVSADDYFGKLGYTGIDGDTRIWGVGMPAGDLDLGENGYTLYLGGRDLGYIGSGFMYANIDETGTSPEWQWELLPLELFVINSADIMANSTATVSGDPQCVHLDGYTMTPTTDIFYATFGTVDIPEDATLNIYDVLPEATAKQTKNVQVKYVYDETVTDTKAKADGLIYDTPAGLGAIYYDHFNEELVNMGYVIYNAGTLNVYSGIIDAFVNDDCCYDGIGILQEGAGAKTTVDARKTTSDSDPCDDMVRISGAQNMEGLDIADAILNDAIAFSLFRGIYDDPDSVWLYPSANIAVFGGDLDIKAGVIASDLEKDTLGAFEAPNKGYDGIIGVYFDSYDADSDKYGTLSVSGGFISGTPCVSDETSVYACDDTDSYSMGTGIYAVQGYTDITGGWIVGTTAICGPAADEELGAYGYHDFTNPVCMAVQRDPEGVPYMADDNKLNLDELDDELNYVYTVYASEAEPMYGSIEDYGEDLNSDGVSLQLGLNFGYGFSYGYRESVSGDIWDEAVKVETAYQPGLVSMASVHMDESNRDFDEETGLFTGVTGFNNFIGNIWNWNGGLVIGLDDCGDVDTPDTVYSTFDFSNRVFGNDMMGLYAYTNEMENVNTNTDIYGTVYSANSNVIPFVTTGDRGFNSIIAGGEIYGGLFAEDNAGFMIAGGLIDGPLYAVENTSVLISSTVNAVEEGTPLVLTGYDAAKALGLSFENDGTEYVKTWTGSYEDTEFADYAAENTYFPTFMGPVVIGLEGSMNPITGSGYDTVDFIQMHDMSYPVGTVDYGPSSGFTPGYAYFASNIEGEPDFVLEGGSVVLTGAEVVGDTYVDQLEMFTLDPDGTVFDPDEVNDDDPWWFTELAAYYVLGGNYGPLKVRTTEYSAAGAPVLTPMDIMDMESSEMLSQRVQLHEGHFEKVTVDEHKYMGNSGALTPTHNIGDVIPGKKGNFEFDGIYYGGGRYNHYVTAGASGAETAVSGSKLDGVDGQCLTLDNVTVHNQVEELHDYLISVDEEEAEAEPFVLNVNVALGSIFTASPMSDEEYAGACSTYESTNAYGTGIPIYEMELDMPDWYCWVTDTPLISLGDKTVCLNGNDIIGYPSEPVGVVPSLITVLDGTLNIYGGADEEDAENCGEILAFPLEMSDGDIAAVSVGTPMVAIGPTEPEMPEGAPALNTANVTLRSTEAAVLVWDGATVNINEGSKITTTWTPDGIWNEDTDEPESMFSDYDAPTAIYMMGYDSEVNINDGLVCSVGNAIENTTGTLTVNGGRISAGYINDVLDGKYIDGEMVSTGDLQKPAYLDSETDPCGTYENTAVWLDGDAVFSMHGGTLDGAAYGLYAEEGQLGVIDGGLITAEDECAIYIDASGVFPYQEDDFGCFRIPEGEDHGVTFDDLYMDVDDGESIADLLGKDLSYMDSEGLETSFWFNEKNAELSDGQAIAINSVDDPYMFYVDQDMSTGPADISTPLTEGDGFTVVPRGYYIAEILADENITISGSNTANVYCEEDLSNLPGELSAPGENVKAYFVRAGKPFTFYLNCESGFVTDEVVMLHMSSGMAEEVKAMEGKRSSSKTIAAMDEDWMLEATSKKHVEANSSPGAGIGGGLVEKSNIKSDSVHVSANLKTAAKGDKVTITADEGFVPVVTDVNGKTVAVKDLGDGKYEFTMPAGEVVISTAAEGTAAETTGKCDGGKHCPAKHFTDVKASKWYHEAVDYMVENGLMNGTTEDTFEPNSSTTRAMVITILARMDGVDTSVGKKWYTAAKEWAMSNEISDGTMLSNEVTREQFVTMIYRFVQFRGMDVAVNNADALADFSDGKKVSKYAKDAMTWAVDFGLIQGSNGKIEAKANATRAEVATLLMRLNELLNK